MTIEEKEIFESIICQPKWYAQIMGRDKHLDAQSANRVKDRFYKGTLSGKMLEQIFNKFNYVKKEKVWQKL